MGSGSNGAGKSQRLKDWRLRQRSNTGAGKRSPNKKK